MPSVHQYIVDIYAKIETEQLIFIRLDQIKLRSEENYLRDVVVNDGNTINVRRLTILPSLYTDIFITFTCNPAWDNIQNPLLPRQLPMDRHDITTRVFRQKLKLLMDFMIKHEYVDLCAAGSVEWQKKDCHMHIY
ncbi:unnamed protein product [Onchocerca ochengi]|uniref:Helitron_like_N domain-containing protein n=1 Tax=Onchocerca ochengi TaxID=42157 RepID=A0A182EMI4_ONCOC|nr:unnamed protein product [Onchocerca ochengi]